MDPITALLMGGSAIGSIFSAQASADAAKQAAATQARTAKENRALSEKYTALSLDDLDSALGTALGTLDTGKTEATGYLSPYANAGQGALSRLSDIYGLNGAEGTARGLSGFTASPGYEFRLSQGVQALDRSANAHSGLYSGAQGKALVDYGQNVGSAEWGNYIGGLTGLANGGQNAAGNLSGMAANMYGSRANAMLGTGQAKAGARASGLSAITGANSQVGAAQAGGMINQANAWNAGLQNLSTLAMFGGSQMGGRQAPANPFGFR